MDPFFSSIWELAKAAGPFGVVLMLWLYIRVDNERKEVSKQLMETTKNIQTMNAQWLEMLHRLPSEFKDSNNRYGGN